MNADLRRFWRELSPSTRYAYRTGWRQWEQWCASVNLDPLRATFTDAQAWIDSMAHRGLAHSTMRRHVLGVRMALEYLAMLGHQPHEPFHRTTIPERRAPPIAQARFHHEPLTDQRIAKALHDTRGDDRAHLLLWLCAGMGLAAADVANVTPAKTYHVGAHQLLALNRGGRAHLIPMPREVLVLTVDGWPFHPRSPDYVRRLLTIHLNPYLATSARELRAWHRACAVDLGDDPDRVETSLNNGRSHGNARWAFSTHSAVTVCNHLHNLLLDFDQK